MHVYQNLLKRIENIICAIWQTKRVRIYNLAKAYTVQKSSISVPVFWLSNKSFLAWSLRAHFWMRMSSEKFAEKNVGEKKRILCCWCNASSCQIPTSRLSSPFTSYKSMILEHSRKYSGLVMSCEIIFNFMRCSWKNATILWKKRQRNYFSTTHTN